MSSDREHVIVGTAGHIDHGKTALVKALTGIDLDTLPDEKKRGITIELGFAFMETPSLDKSIVFIDVPGHERLIKTMVAGASHIDAVMFVIAADEGISAQTLEHLDIVQLLGISDGFVALTKADLVDPERLRMVIDEVKQFLSGTFLAQAPVIPVSSIRGEGVDDVKQALLEVAKKPRTRVNSGVFRMPIDRVFTMRGFGTVVAGTVLSGEVKVEDKLEILPEGMGVRVRGLQIHDDTVRESSIGRRTAINLQGVKKEQCRRGQCLCAPGSITSSRRIDARLHILQSYGEDLKNRTRIRFHVGTDEVIGRVVLLDREAMSPGETWIVQVVLESPTTALRQDRFIIRGFSSLHTIGGGIVLDAQASPHKRSDQERLRSLGSLEKDIKTVVEQAFLKTRYTPENANEVALSLGESVGDVIEAMAALVESDHLVAIGRVGGELEQALQKHIHSSILEELSGKMVSFVKEYFSAYPHKYWMPSADLQSKFVKIASKQIYDKTLADLCKKRIFLREGTRIGLVGREIQWRPGERETSERIEKVFLTAGFATPPDEDVLNELRIPHKLFGDLIDGLIDSGRLVRLSDKVTYHADTVIQARKQLSELLDKNREVTAGEFRDRLSVSRKYVIPLLEYFDRIGFTRREGDRRVRSGMSENETTLDKGEVPV